MTRDDIRKLIGGYATGTLTETERKRLFEAALDDQELFDELSREQALRELLEEPGAKQRLLAALEKPEHQPASIAWWRRPWPWAVAATVALAVALASLLPQKTARPAEVAVISQPAPPPAPALRESNQAAPAPHAMAPAKKAKKLGAQKIETAAPAAQPEPRVQPEQATIGALGGAPGSALAPSLSRAKSAAFASRTGRFALDYSVGPDGYLSVNVAGDGYLAVGAASPRNFQLIPIAGNGRVLNGSTTRLKIPEGAEELIITFAARAPVTHLDTGLMDRVDAVSGNKDGTSGTLEDPNPSPDSKLIATVRVSR